MTAMTSYSANHSSCSAAAANTSAHNIPILDTAMDLVVSICILAVRLLLPNM